MQAKITPQSYLANIDAMLNAISDAEKRGGIIEDEMRRVDQATRALDRWAWRGRGKRPTPFSAFELTTITLELSNRLAHWRDEANIQTQIAAE